MARTATVAAWRDVDLATVRLLADGKDGFKRSWIMLMPEGEYEHPQYGKLEFSRTKLQEFKDNFDNRVRRIDIALDQDHDGGKATGWLEELQLRDGGLWGKVRWTPLGQQLLTDQIYRYFSPEFGTFTDPESGKKFSNVIIGGALTNRPFLKDMPAVKLKARFERPGQYTKSDREKIADADFAGPNKTFPIVTQQDVHDAARLIGHAANPAAVKARIKAIAKRKGFSLPAAWADEEGGSTAASERNADVAGTRKSRMLADPEPAEDERELEDDEQDALDESDESDESDGDGDETEDENTLDMLGEDGASDAEDSDEDEDEALSEPQTLADKKPMAKSKSKSKAKSSKKPANDAEDAIDGGADEDEELDDMAPDDMAYDDGTVDEEEMPAPKREKGKGKGMPVVKKMSESEMLSELTRLREVNQRLREEQFKHEVSRTLAEFTRDIRSEARDEEFALPRSFRQAYQAWMLSHGVRLSEGERGGLNDLVKLALRVGTVPLTSLANNVADADDRRPRSSKNNVDQTPEAEMIALSEFKKPLTELDHATVTSIYMRLARGRERKGNSAA